MNCSTHLSVADITSAMIAMTCRLTGIDPECRAGNSKRKLSERSSHWRHLQEHHNTILTRKYKMGVHFWKNGVQPNGIQADVFNAYSGLLYFKIFAKKKKN